MRTGPAERTAASPADISEPALMSKVTWRLIPFMFLLYIVAYLDRVNVSFAKLQMQQELGLSEAVYGTGMGIFFIGYFLLEVPSNLILERVGARPWIARIMITWGLIAAAMMFVHDKWAFYSLRFLLGLAEAGFFPGMILYLTYWFPAAERAKSVGRFMTATTAANILGGPVSGALLKMHGIGGLHGWQWLFLLEGLPSCILGFIVLLYLPNGPQDARWLNDAERSWIQRRLANDHGDGHQRHHTLDQALKSGKVWLLCALYFCVATAHYGFGLWLPSIVKGSYKLDDLQVGFITAIPYIAAAIGLVVIGTHSDRTGERRWHIAAPALWGAAGIALAGVLLIPGLPLSHEAAVLLALLSLTLAAFGMWGVLGPFWTLPPTLLSGSAAAAGIALINSVGNLGGFFGPTMVGWLKQYSGESFTNGLLFVAVMLVFIAGIAISVRVPPHQPAAERS